MGRFLDGEKDVFCMIGHKCMFLCMNDTWLSVYKSYCDGFTFPQLFFFFFNERPFFSLPDDLQLSLPKVEKGRIGK